MISEGNPYLPVGLPSFCLLQGQWTVTFLWVLEFDIVGKSHINWIIGVIDLKNLFFAESLKTDGSVMFSWVATFLSLSAQGRRVHQRSRRARRFCSQKAEH